MISLRVLSSSSGRSSDEVRASESDNRGAEEDALDQMQRAVYWADVDLTLIVAIHGNFVNRQHLQ